MFQDQNKAASCDDVVPKSKYDLLEEKYNQSVESYNQLLHHLKQLQRSQFGSKSERFTELFDGQQALFEAKELDETGEFDSEDEMMILIRIQKAVFL